VSVGLSGLVMIDISKCSFAGEIRGLGRVIFYRGSERVNRRAEGKASSVLFITIRL
jgi:hypothetical protein